MHSAEGPVLTPLSRGSEGGSGREVGWRPLLPAAALGFTVYVNRLPSRSQTGPVPWGKTLPWVRMGLSCGCEGREVTVERRGDIQNT